jgi:hypothetical protein
VRALHEQGLAFDRIDLENPVVRVFGSAAILTAESKTYRRATGSAHMPTSGFVAVYAQERDAIQLVHFQSTMLPAGISSTPNEAP